MSGVEAKTLTVGDLTVAVEEHADGTMTLAFKSPRTFRVRRAKMGMIPVPIRFKVPKDTAVSLTIEPSEPKPSKPSKPKK